MNKIADDTSAALKAVIQTVDEIVRLAPKDYFTHGADEFSAGACGALARMIYDATEGKFPGVGVIVNYKMVHVAIQLGDDQFLDANGISSKAQLIRTWKNYPFPHKFTEIAEVKLVGKNPIWYDAANSGDHIGAPKDRKFYDKFFRLLKQHSVR